MYTCYVVGSTIYLEPNLCTEYNCVQDVVVVAIDLNRRCVRLRAMLFMIVVEICFAKPATVHHDFVPSVDLQAKLSEVQKVPVRSINSSNLTCKYSCMSHLKALSPASLCVLASSSCDWLWIHTRLVRL